MRFDTRIFPKGCPMMSFVSSTSITAEWLSRLGAKSTGDGGGAKRRSARTHVGRSSSARCEVARHKIRRVHKQLQRRRGEVVSLIGKNQSQFGSGATRPPALGVVGIEVRPPDELKTPADGLSNFTSRTAKVPIPHPDAHWLEMAIPWKKGSGASDQAIQDRARIGGELGRTR
jgi:hypothetical protein